MSDVTFEIAPITVTFITGGGIPSSAMIPKSDFDAADQILASTAASTPAALDVAEQTLVGRITGGSIDDLSAAQVRTMINVEDGATADQSDAEIKTAYENNADTNAFTDADQVTLASAMQDLIDDTTPQLGGDLDAQGNDLTALADLTQTGVRHVATGSITADTGVGGIVITEGGGTTTTGLCYYLDGGTGSWLATDADATSSTELITVALALGTDPDVDGMFIGQGVFNAASALADHSAGAAVYIAGATLDTAGHLTTVQPAAGKFVRPVGVCLGTADEIFWTGGLFSFEKSP